MKSTTQLAYDFTKFSDRLRWARERTPLTQTQVAAMVGLTQGAYSKLERGGGGSEKTTSLAKVLRVNALWLETGDGAPARPLADDDNYVAIRRVGVKVNGSFHGEPVEFIDEDGEPVFFQRSWLDSMGLDAEKLYATKVRGPSMEPTVYDGDMVVFNTGSTEPRDGVAFAINFEGEPVIKRLVRDDGQWWLDSDNPDKSRFPRKRCSSDQVMIVGEIVHRQSSRI